MKPWKWVQSLRGKYLEGEKQGQNELVKSYIEGINEDEYLKYRKVNKEILRKSREYIHNRNHEREELSEEGILWVSLHQAVMAPHL